MKSRHDKRINFRSEADNFLKEKSSEIILKRQIFWGKQERISGSILQIISMFSVIVKVDSSAKNLVGRTLIHIFETASVKCHWEILKADSSYKATKQHKN